MKSSPWKNGQLWGWGEEDVEHGTSCGARKYESTSVIGACLNVRGTQEPA